MTAAFVYDATRTRFGKHGGALAGSYPTTWPPTSARRWSRAPAIYPERIDEFIFGDANDAGEHNRNVIPMATVWAGPPTNIPGTPVNRLCGSSLEAAIVASGHFATGGADVVVIGAVAAMSRAPCVLPKTDKPYPSGNPALTSRVLSRRQVNPALPSCGRFP
jgi:acetyl-CoA acyltransferase